MLTKETKAIAETIAQELAPNYKELARLGAKFIKARTEERKASEQADSWHWKRTTESKNKLAENVHEWGEIREKLNKEEHEKETALIVARYNYTTALYDLCSILGELVRPVWQKLEPKQGLKSLCEYINQANEPKGKGYTPEVARVFIYRGYDFIDTKQFEIKAFSLGACGLIASKDIYYEKNEQEEPHETRERQRLTVAQYLAKIKKLEEIRKQAEELEHKKRIIGGDLLYFGFAKDWHIQNN